MTDTDSLVPDDEPEEAAASAPVETAPAGGSAVASSVPVPLRQMP